MSETKEETSRSNFIKQIIEHDLAEGKYASIVTRFPPEPNGYLHIGHAKSICLNFGLAQQYPGRCHLRFDDTNPAKEDTEYVESIKNDVQWLGFDWGEHLYFASNYFERMYEFAVKLIKKGKAYVDSADRETMREYRGSLSEAGRPTPDRDRSVEENLDLFRRMRDGEFPDGAYVLRAKIDLANPNMLMRDPVLYRIQHAHHHNTGDAWAIYPMYDFAHCLEDALEGVTHSICTLEFENNRELYDWVIAEAETEHVPHQYEFARLSINYTVMSKRKLLRLVKEGFVSGWDDPRMPTIAGLRRRGIRPEAIRRFADLIGVAKANSMVDVDLLEFAIRDDLNHEAKRVMAVIDPLKVTITNYPEGEVDWLDCAYWPHDVPREGERKVPFTRELYIERSDFAENPAKGWYRLSPGREVRLRYAYYVTCDEVVKDDAGNVIELKCSYDPETRGGSSADGRKVKGTIHWVSGPESLPCEIRLYDRLFAVPEPEADPDVDFVEHLNPDSLVVHAGRVEPSVLSDEPGTRYQFERQGYFWADPVDSTDDALVFNRVVSLKDTWAKQRTKSSAPVAKPSPNKAKPAKKAESKDGEAERPAKKPATYERDRAREANPFLAKKLESYQADFGLDYDDADLLTAGEGISDFFENALAEFDAPNDVAKWLVNTLLPEVGETDELSGIKARPVAVAKIVRRVSEGKITAAVSREVLLEVLESGKDPDAVIAEKGLEKVASPDALEPIIEQVLADNPDELARYRDGKTSLFGFFIGKVMQATGGAADARVVRTLLQEKL